MALPKASGSGTGRFRSLIVSKRTDTARVSPPVQPPVLKQKAVILLTGFGPFPGVSRNVSADLVVEVARLAALRQTEFRFVCDVLPVEWAVAPARLEGLLEQHRPVMAIHFGVSARARSFVIETHAYNEIRNLPDETGQCATTEHLVMGDRTQRRSTLPVERALQALRSAGYPAELSSDPGRYLCNAILFHSLRHAARAKPRTRTGFIHVPATLEPGILGEPSLLDWKELRDGGVHLIEFCLAALHPRAVHLS
jgi:pyroglutamyl-peptidase